MKEKKEVGFRQASYLGSRHKIAKAFEGASPYEGRIGVTANLELSLCRRCDIASGSAGCPGDGGPQTKAVESALI